MAERLVVKDSGEDELHLQWFGDAAGGIAFVFDKERVDASPGVLLSRPDLARIRDFANEVLGDGQEPTLASDMGESLDARLDAMMGYVFRCGPLLLRDDEPSRRIMASLLGAADAVDPMRRANGISVGNWRATARRAEQAAADMQRQRDGAVNARNVLSRELAEVTAENEALREQVEALEKALAEAAQRCDMVRHSLDMAHRELMDARGARREQDHAPKVDGWRDWAEEGIRRMCARMDALETRAETAERAYSELANVVDGTDAS